MSEVMPTMVGPVGEAWEHDLDAIRRRYAKPGQKDGSVASWVVKAPWANILWHSYWLNLVHLRPLGLATPTRFYLEGAAHELWLYALNPDHPLDLMRFPPPRLEPMNFGAQFVAESDAAAAERVRAAVVEIVEGKLSPDTDYTRQWIARFGDNMIRPEHRATAGQTVVMTRYGNGHGEKLVFDPKPADAVPRCIHGKLPVEGCAVCAEMRADAARRRRG